MASAMPDLQPMALSRVVSEIFNVEKCRDLEIVKSGSKVTQGQ